MGKLYGYKRWYGFREKGEKFDRKVKIKRKYDEIEGKYNIKIDEVNNKTKIENYDFINNLKRYKKKNGEKVSGKFSKFNMGNVLFKLKMDENNEFLGAEKIISKVELLSRSTEFSEKIKRKELEELIEKKLENNEIDENTEKFKIKIGNTEEIDVKIDNSKDFDKTQSGYVVKWKKLDEDEVRIKREIYKKFQEINEKIYGLMIDLSDETDPKNIRIKKEYLEKRYYKEYLRSVLLEEKTENIEKIKKLFEEIKNSVNDEINIDGFISFYSNIGEEKKGIENKKIFIDKVLNYINNDIEISNEEIADYLIKELEYWDIIKRVEKINSYYKKLEKTYIEYDKHEKFKIEKDKKNEIVKYFIDDIKTGLMRDKIKKILEEFKIGELAKKLKDKTKNKNFDTEIFDIYKKHYKSVIYINKFNNMSDNEKELYKIVYRYIKGRIDKILINRNEKDLDSKIKDWVNEENLLEKIEKRVKQYTLEHVMYLGKIKHRGLEKEEVNTLKFQELHGQEEFELELITFFSAVNMELNKIFKGKEEITDFFGYSLNGQKLVLKEKVPSFKLNILRRLNFINNENNIDEKLSDFYSFQQNGYSLRNKILHGSSKKIDDYMTKDDLKDRYENIKNVINQLRISDEEISKSVNLDIVFEGKIDIINKINDLPIGEYKEKKYLPSFSKIIPEVVRKFREINKNKMFDSESEKIILNAIKYVNKILYEKIISNEQNEFIKTLPDKLVKKNNNGKENKNTISIEEYYKNAQVLSSKGNKKAIKKYKNKIIDIYIKYLENNFKEVIDFLKFNLNLKEIKTKIDERKDSKSKIVLNSVPTEIDITNDFEYVLTIYALLSNNTYINKIRNRFFSTLTWLDEPKYENIINLLDEIVSINLLRENNIKDILELETSIIEAKIIENDEKYIKEYVFEKNEKKLKKSLFSEELIDKEEILKIFGDKNFEFKNFIKKKENGNLTINFDILSNLEYELNLSRRIIGKNSKSLNLFIERVISEYKSNIRTTLSSEFLKKYKEKIDNLIANEDKFEKIYYPEKNKNKLYIYKKNLFLNIGNPNFDNIYGLISEDIKTADAKKLFNDDIRNNKILEVDKVLKNLNDKLNGYSKDFKDKYIEKLKEKDNNFFAKNIKSEKYKSFDEFEKDYNEVSEYKKIRDLLEFNYLNKIESYLIDINWKLAIQMARFERDVHYIVNGLKELSKITYRGIRNERSMAYCKYDENKNINLEQSHYEFDEIEYKKFEKICYSLGLDLTADSEVQKKGKENIRNYVSHFYIIREPFKKYSLAKQIDKVSKLMEYSTRYNNSTYNSVFEVFKKDVDLNYDNLKKKFKLHVESNSSAEVFNITDLIKPKKVSVLELEHYNSEFVMKLIEEILTKEL